MPRPKTKTELVTAANQQFMKLWMMIASLSEEKQAAGFNFEDRDRNLRDVLMHLYEWHKMVMSWYQIGTVEGGIPDVPGKGYTWRTTPELNRELWKRVQDVPLAVAKDKLKASHQQIMDIIDAHSNEELFARGFYPWTKSNALGAYFISATSSHYDWAMKKIKNHIKTQQ